MNANLQPRKSGGFNLVELMIVLAILGLLAAIAIPNFQRARAISQRNAQLAGRTLLPPGITDTNMVPVPMVAEWHLGTWWIIARGMTNAAVVVYFSDSVSLLRESRVSASTPGLDHQNSDLETLEIVAAVENDAGKHVSGIFRLTPLLIAGDTDFISVSDKELAILSSMVETNRARGAKQGFFGSQTKEAEVSH